MAYTRPSVNAPVTVGFLVLDPDGGGSGSVPVVDRVFIGRECAGIEESRRILFEDDPQISRNHAEVRVDPETTLPCIVDTSSNGTRVNGRRIERAVSVPLHGGDRIMVGSHVLEFRSETPLTRGAERGAPRATVTVDGMQPMALVVGDLINFSTVSEQADQHLLAREVGSLYGALREILPRYHGTLLNYMGDAFFAGWELESDPDGVDKALGFAVEAATSVVRSTAASELRYADRSPLRMGWAVTMGPVVIHLMPGSVVTAIGDFVNVAFRVASIAGREGRPDILATEEVRQGARRHWLFGDPETVTVKGRTGAVTIRGVTPT